MAAAVLQNNTENDMNASNKLLAGACGDDDNELTEEQKAIIAERLAALQARFKVRLYDQQVLSRASPRLSLWN